MPALSRPALRLAFTALLSAAALILALPLAEASSPVHATVLRPPAPSFFNVQPPTSNLQPPTSTLTASVTALGDPVTAGKIDPALRKRLLNTGPDERIPIVVEMREQPSLDVAMAQTSSAARAEAVVSALQATAARSQIGVRAFLAAKTLAGRASDVRSFWVFNGFAAHLAAGDIAALAARDDVALIREDHYRRWINQPSNHPTIQPSIHPSIQPSNYQTVSPANSSVEWGIARIRADEVWAALNVTGTGVVVANLDTGVDWQHPALQVAYRGYNKGLINHVGNWFDATDAGATYPIDPHGHGTHTIGTIVGADGIGVAPGARWIAIRVLNADGYGFDSWIHAGFQWALAPNGDPSLAPNVLNNSWGSPFSGDTTFQNDLRALRAVGILAVFSSGNDGPDPGTVGAPASLPEALAVGAIDDEDAVASFSSRGPSPWGEVRPHIVAPGVSVRSSIPGGRYTTASGTSMAAPHVAGTIALMLSANPSLMITDTVFVLTRTAVPLSTTIPNNDSGYGRIDAYAAVQSVANLGTLSGTVTRADTAAPIAGATVSAVSDIGTFGAATTDATGHYVRSLAASVYTATVSAFGYVTQTRMGVFIITGTTTSLDSALVPLPTGSVRGSLTDAGSGQPISGTIVVVNTPVTGSASNTYAIALPGGMFELRAIAPGHRALTASVTITPGQIVTRNFALPVAPSILLVDSGPWYSGSQIDYYRATLDRLGYLYSERRVRNTLTDAPVSATLAPYDIVIWSAPLDSPGLIGAGDPISRYLSSGGSLFLSGQDVGYWDGGFGSGDSAYYFDRLKARVLQDDSLSRALTGTGVFTGVNLSIQGVGGANNQTFPDAIGSTDRDATADAFTYHNGFVGGQITGLCLPYRAVNLGFGFEGITDAATRDEVMSRTLAYFGSPRNTAGMTLVSNDDLLIAPAGNIVTGPLRLRNIAELGGSDTFVLSAQSSGWSVSLSDASVALDSCRDRMITATISIPPGTPTDVSQSITITARSTISPALVVSDTFVVKSPALVLLVDDDRWYEVESAYQTALISDGLSFDRWNVPKSWAGLEPSAPSSDRLSWYRFVVWFTGYDWYQPLTADNQVTLTQYLDAGGRVLISSQSHLGWSGLNEFNQARLGILDAGYVTTTLARGPRGSPFDGIDTQVLSYTFPNYSESPAPYPTATLALVGSHGRPIALAHAEGAGKALFMSFPFESIPEVSRAAVMERAIGYLSWLGGSTVAVDKDVVAPGSLVSVTVALRNDGPAGLSSAAFAAALPPGVSWQSGNSTWSGSLAPGQVITTVFTVSLGGLPPGSLAAIPITFTDGDHGITFHKEARIGIARSDLSASTIGFTPGVAHSAQVVTWTIVARNTGPAAATSAVVTGLLPIDATVISGTLTASAGAASALSDTVQWSGSIPAGGVITITYRMTTPLTLIDRLRFGSALFDDGAVLSQAGAWLPTQPYRTRLLLIYKSSR